VFRQNNPLPEPVMRDVQDAAHAKGVQLDILKAATQAEIEAAFATLAQLRVGGLLLGPDPFLNRQRDQLVALAARHAVPVIYDFRQNAAASRKLAELARKSGVDVTLEVVPEMQHVFQFLAGSAPEADAAIRRLADWVRPKLGLG